MPEMIKQPAGQDGVSIVVPVFNEAEGLAAFIRQLETFAASHTSPVQIILVDDGSTDSSYSILLESNHTVIQHPSNLGYGAAVKSGIENAGYESVVMIDADGTYPVHEISALLSHLKTNDMVVGARVGQDVHIPLIRRPAKWLIRHFASWMVRRQIPDLNSGLRAIHRSEVMKIIRLLPDGFSLTTTLTVALHTSGKKVYYEKINYGKRSGASKFRPWADTWNLILLILRTVVLIRPLNVFLPLSVLLMTAAFFVLVISKFVYGEFMDATFIVLMTTSIQMFVLGLIADLIVRINLWTH